MFGQSSENCSTRPAPECLEPLSAQQNTVLSEISIFRSQIRMFWQNVN